MRPSKFLVKTTKLLSSLITRGNQRLLRRRKKLSLHPQMRQDKTKKEKDRAIEAAKTKEAEAEEKLVKTMRVCR